MSDLNSDKNLFGVDLEVNETNSLKGKYHPGWVEESVVFEENFGKQIKIPHSKNFIGNSFSKNKYRYLLTVVLCIFVLLYGKIFFLQIISGSKYYLAAENNRQRLIPIPAERGLIYDRNNLPLVENIPNFSLSIIPQNLPRNKAEREEIINKLATITSQDAATINNFLEEYKNYSYEFITIKENLDYETALKIQLQTPDLPGISIQRGSKRHYIAGESLTTLSNSIPSSFSHLLGYEGKLNRSELDKYYAEGYLPVDYIGKIGIEKSYEKNLRGVYGKKRIEVNSQGREQSVLAEEAPIPGNHLKLAIDVKMQNKLEEIMKAYLKIGEKTMASGIVLNPNNGEILAMISLPTFNNNDFADGISQEKYSAYINNKSNPLFNRAISGKYPSGSSIKPAITAIALQLGIITPETSFLSSGGLQVGQWFFPDWQAGGHGLTNARKALAWSVNTFFYYIGGGYGNFVGMGVEKMMAGLRQFNFGSELGIDLPGEESGFLPSKEWKQQTLGERWYIGDTYNLSIGQGNLLVTPLQIADMTASIANGGTIYRPHLVHSIIDPVNNTEKIVTSTIINTNFISQNNLKTVRLGMRDCVIFGSCRRLSDLSFTAAGKTGTAQWNSNKANHAWFTSFAPFDKPEIVVTIMVEEGGEGSAISVPIANDFYKWWWGYINQN